LLRQSLRIWSAREKLRASWHCTLRDQRVDGFIVSARGRKFRSHLVKAAGPRCPLQRAAGWLRVAVFNHIKDRIEAGQHGKMASRSSRKSWPWSMAVFEARTDRK